MTHILEDNVFEFNGAFFRQVKGTAMGTKMAPAYAGLFMAKTEKDFIESQDEETKNSLVLWKRFIDDIFVVWRCSRDGLLHFLERLNETDPDIKFTWNIDEKEVNYLDVYIYKGPRSSETGHLDTRTHIKETNSSQYVHASSCHPYGLQRSGYWRGHQA